MVAVAADDTAGILMHLLCKLRIFVPVLPTRCRYNDEESQLVAGIHEGGILRIVGSTDDGKAEVAESLGVAPLLRVG